MGVTGRSDGEYENIPQSDIIDVNSNILSLHERLEPAFTISIPMGGINGNTSKSQLIGFKPRETFPEGSPIPFPPSTGPTWPDDESSPQDAVSFGQKHQEAIAAVERRAEQNGGGLLGAAKGFLNEYERR